MLLLLLIILLIYAHLIYGISVKISRAIKQKKQATEKSENEINVEGLIASHMELEPVALKNNELSIKNSD